MSNSSETFESCSFEVDSDSSSEEKESIEINIISGPLICACTFSNASILVFNNQLIKEINNIRHRIKSNITILEIVVYQGFLYALSCDKKLYRLINEAYNTDSWNWTKVDLNLDITHISATLDQQHLWLQSDNLGGFYLAEFSKIDFFRNYGFTKEDYLDIYFDRVLYKDEIFTNVLDAILDGHNHLHLILKNDKFTKLVLLNWIVYHVIH